MSKREDLQERINDAAHEVEKFSMWKNIDDVRYTFSVATEKKRGRKGSGTVFKDITIGPGETLQISSDYDQAIRQTDLTGKRVMGGLCPKLVKLGEETVPVLPDCLNWQVAEEKIRVDALAKKMQEEAARTAAVQYIAIEKAQAPVVLPVAEEAKRAPGRPPGRQPKPFVTQPEDKIF